MHVVMQLNGGPSHGFHNFQDNDDIIKRIKHIKDRNIRVAMVLYHHTHKGQIPNASQPKFQPVIGERLADLKFAGRQYQIISRKENRDDKTVEIVAQYDPPD